MRIQVVQHVPFEGPAYLAAWATARGYTMATTRLYAGESLPDVSDLDRLIVMGGPMNIYEEDAYPWLVDEKALIRDAIEAGRSVVGVCLGAQLIADVLGSRVVPLGYKEIGWFPLTLTEAGQAYPALESARASLPVFHWHGETFALPEGAVHLARSEACAQQAFLWDDRVLGLQCHLEMTPPSIDAILDGCAPEFEAAQGQRWVQPLEAVRAVSEDTYAQCFAMLDALLEALAT